MFLMKMLIKNNSLIIYQYNIIQRLKAQNNWANANNYLQFTLIIII